MLTQRLLTLLASCAPALTTANIIRDPTQEDFNTHLQKKERLLVSFTSPTLDSVAPFNNLFTQAAVNSSTSFVTVNCDVEFSLCAKYDINAYPTIRLFEQNDEKEIQVTRYRGPRTIKALQSFIKKRELPILSHLHASDMQFRRIDPIVIIAYLGPSSPLLDTFTSAAQRHHHDFAFGYVTDVSIAEKEKVTIPSLLSYRNNDGDNVMRCGNFTEADVDEFLVEAWATLIKDFREKDADVFMQTNRLTVYIFTSEEENKKIRHELTLLAKTYLKYVTFGIVDTKRYPEMPANFGVEMEGETALVVHAPMNDNVFFWEQGREIKDGGVERMLKTILQGKAREGQVFVAEEEEKGGHDEL